MRFSCRINGKRARFKLLIFQLYALEHSLYPLGKFDDLIEITRFNVIEQCKRDILIRRNIAKEDFSVLICYVLG